MKQWITANAAFAQNDEIKQQFGAFLGEILLRRGVTDMQQAQDFFGCGSLSDPYEMADMSAAVEAIRAALDEDKHITIYGDYDCDGVTSTVMLYSYLEAMGAQVDFYIPDRSEGYGMNMKSLEILLDGGTELIITVDNGISAVAEAEYIASRGAQLVITDHHQPPETLPVCVACVDPHRNDDNSKFKELCGAGVVLKLLCALEDDQEFVLEQYADLAAIGTIGDVVPLCGENRFIVRRGLESIKQRQNIGLERLIRSSGMDADDITAVNIAFTVCPRINAASRMSGEAGNPGAAKAARLLLADTADTASRLADELSILNDRRRATETEIMESIERQIAEDPRILNERIIIAAGEGWNHGVVGIAATRVMERFGKPAFIISVDKGEARGSARSLEGFSVYRMLNACEEVLTKYGGHPKAGGFSMLPENVERFRELAYKYAREQYFKMPVQTVCADMEVTCADLTKENVELLSRLEPFGEGNRQPMFLLKGCILKSKRAIKNGKYTSFEVESGGTTLKALTFKISFDKFFPEVGSRVDIIALAELNEFNGVTSVNLKVQELRPSDFVEERFFAAQRVYEEISRGEGCDKRLAPRVIPQDRKALMAIYDLIKKCGGNMSAEDMVVYSCGVNYCMLRITMDAFAEAEMIKLAVGAESAEIVPAPKKCDLFSTGLLARLSQEMLSEQK